MKKGKMFKKSISCLLAALMIIASMPFSAISASAATGTLSAKSYQIVSGGTTNRWEKSQFNIVNDQEADNTSIGIMEYDISSLKGMVINSASLNFTIDSYNDDSQGLVFYYSNRLTNVTLSNGFTTDKTLTYGAGTVANESAASRYGFSTGNVLAYGSVNTSAQTSDIKTQLQTIIDSGATSVYVFIMQKTAGGKHDKRLDGSSTNDGWTDTKIKPTNVTISVNYEVDTPENINPSVKKLIDNGAYTGNASKAADGSYTKSNLASRDELSNVLWSYGVSSSSPYKSKGDSYWYDAGVQFGEITFLYDGANTMACPVNFFVKRTGSTFNSGYNQKPHSVYAMSTNYVQLKHYWHGTNTSATYQTSADYCVNTVNSHTVANPKSKDLTFKNETNYYSNTLYLKPEYLGFGTSNLFTIENTEWHFYVADDNKSDTSGFDSTLNTSGSANGNMTIRVLNYKPIKDAMSEIKSFYNNYVYGQENYYTSTSLSEYYNAISKVCFDPNSYFDTSSTSGNNYTACLNALNDAVSAIDTAKGKKLVKRKVNVTYRFIDGTEKVQQENAGELASDLTEHTSNSGKYVDITADSHKTVNYVWNIPNVKLLNDTVIEETQVLGNSEYHDFSDNKEECACGYKLDFSAYNNAGGEYASILMQQSQYDSTSYSAYTTKVKEFQGLRNSVHSQADLDKITFDLLYAKSLLHKKQGKVTLTVYDANGNVVSDAGDTFTGDYGDTVTVKPKNTCNIVKWVVETNTAKKELVGELPNIDLVVTGDTTVKAYCDNSTTDTENSYTKVIFKGSNGKVSAIKYVKEGDTLKTDTVEKPSLALYTIGEWNVSEVVGSADKAEVTVIAPCEPNTSYQCGIHFEGKEEDVIYKPYDTRIDINDYIQNDKVTYALATDKDGNNIIAYIDGTVFYVPARADVYVVTKDADTKKTMINTVGVYTTTRGIGENAKKTIGFNCKFSLAEGCQALEWGVVFIPIYNKAGGGTKIGTSTVAPIRSLSAQNEYTARINIPASSTSYNSIKAKAYLKYRDEAGEHVIYGNENTQAFDTSTRFWEVK